MKMTVFGTGYVGLVTALGFAELGHTVYCFDSSVEKISMLNRGIMPLYESGAAKRLKSLLNKKIFFYSNINLNQQSSDIYFIAIGLPSAKNGLINTTPLFHLLTQLKPLVKNKPVVLKTTTPIGTHQKLQKQFPTISLVTSPEFLSEGQAFKDFFHPARVIVATESIAALKTIRQLYRPLLKKDSQLLVMEPTSAEITKHAANTMLATKISLMNEIARVCESENGSIDQVRLGLSMDPRIGPHFIRSGIGYGGSCLPKDILALQRLGREKGLVLPLIRAVQQTNALQTNHCLSRLKTLIVKNKIQTLTVWGLSFKPGTDDIRESPALKIVSGLLKLGIRIQAHDPMAMVKSQQHFKSDHIRFFENRQKALENSEGLVILTEWDEYRSASPTDIKKKLLKPFIFDGRNIFDAKQMQRLGLQYFSVGRMDQGH